jgi:hypothetical protein
MILPQSLLLAQVKPLFRLRRAFIPLVRLPGLSQNLSTKVLLQTGLQWDLEGQNTDFTRMATPQALQVASQGALFMNLRSITALLDSLQPICQGRIYRPRSAPIGKGEKIQAVMLVESAKSRYFVTTQC